MEVSGEVPRNTFITRFVSLHLMGGKVEMALLGSLVSSDDDVVDELYLSSTINCINSSCHHVRECGVITSWHPVPLRSFDVDAFKLERDHYGLVLHWHYQCRTHIQLVAQ